MPLENVKKSFVISSGGKNKIFLLEVLNCHEKLQYDPLQNTILLTA